MDVKMKIRGQITIFIIVAIIIIAVVLLLLLILGGREPVTNGKPEESPESFLDLCLKDKIREGIRVIGINGGYIEPEFYIYFKFSDEPQPERISYLCYTQEDYSPCISQEPMLMQHIKQEIKDYIAEDVDGCFDELTQSLQEQGYTVEVKYKRGGYSSVENRYVPGDYNISLETNKVIVDINAELTLTKTGESSQKKGFRVIVPTKIWEILMFPVQEILRREADPRACGFETAEIDQIYTDFNTDKFTTGEGIEIYDVEHLKSKEKFRFAVRSCIIPAGYGT